MCVLTLVLVDLCVLPVVTIWSSLECVVLVSAVLDELCDFVGLVSVSTLVSCVALDVVDECVVFVFVVEPLLCMSLIVPVASPVLSFVRGSVTDCVSCVVVFTSCVFLVFVCVVWVLVGLISVSLFCSVFDLLSMCVLCVLCVPASPLPVVEGKPCVGALVFVAVGLIADCVFVVVEALVAGGVLSVAVGFVAVSDLCELDG